MLLPMNQPIHDFEEAVQQGILLRKAGDECRVRLGLLVLILPDLPGEHSVTDFAKLIGKSRSSLYEYKETVEFYTMEERERYLYDEHSPITYAHLRSAMRKRDHDEAIKYLEDWWGKLATPEEAEFDVNPAAHDKNGDPKPSPWERVRELQVPWNALGNEWNKALIDIRKEIAYDTQLRIVIYKERGASSATDIHRNRSKSNEHGDSGDQSGLRADQEPDSEEQTAARGLEG